MQKVRNALLFSITIGILFIYAAPSVLASESALDFRVAPAAGSQVSDGGDYFVLNMRPGHSRDQRVRVSNGSSKDLEVRLAAADASTAQMGGVDYGSEDAARVATGDWIVLDEPQVALSPGESKLVEFSIKVPSDAGEGVHLAGLSVWVEGTGSQRGTGSPATINLQSRRVIAVQVNLPGAAAPNLEIRGAEAQARPDGLYLGIDLFNLGTDFAKGQGRVSIEGREQGSFLLDTVVPGTGTSFPFRWAATSVPSGSYPVTVEIDYGGRLATWEGEVIVGAGVQDDLRGRGAADGTAMSVRQKILIGGAVAIGAALLLLGLRHFRARPPLKQRLPIRRTASARPIQSTIAGPGSTLPPPAAFVPRSEEMQRWVPPPPPPPPPRPGPAPVAHGRIAVGVARGL